MSTFHLTPRSANVKTGPIPVSTSSAATCPTTCPFNESDAARRYRLDAGISGGGGCYAAHGKLSLHWRKVTAGERGSGLEGFCDAIAKLPAGQVWRMNQAGDLPGDADELDYAALEAIVRANARANARGFTYTHKPTTPANLDAIARANANGFTVNLSANSPAHADELVGNGSPVVTVLPQDVDGAATRTLTTPAGRTIVVCPATYRDDVTCASCKLCAVATRKVIVGFPAHGSAKSRASLAVLANS